MVAAPLHGPAVVLSPATGTVTLLGWHSLRPVKVFHGFRDPEVARIAPGDRYAYVADGETGDLSVIDLARQRIVTVSTSAWARTTWLSARTGHASGLRSARWRPRSSGSTRPAWRTRGSRPPPSALPVAQRRLRARRAQRLAQLGAGAVRHGLQRRDRQGREGHPGRTRPPGDCLLRRAGAAHERLRLVHRGSAVADLPEARHRADAVRVVQPRHLRRTGRDVVAVHRPGRRELEAGRSVASGRRRSRLQTRYVAISVWPR